MTRLKLVLVLTIVLAACGVGGAPKPPGAAVPLPAGVGPAFGR